MIVPRKIAGLGTTVVDLQMTVEQFPRPDSKNQAVASRSQVGGPVPTALVLLQRFGHSCQLASLWGDDPQGELIERDLYRENIQFDRRCRISRTETGTAHVWVDRQSGERTIVCHRLESRPDRLAEVSLPCTRAELLHLDGWGEEPAIELARQVRDNRGLVAFDVGTPKPATKRLLELSHLINAPRRFVQLYFGHDDIRLAADELLSSGTEVVTITDGVRGAWLFTQEVSLHQPAFEIDAVDTTGAGDVFSGAIIHAFLQQLSHEQMLRFASASAALKCREVGNRDALPTLSDVEEFLEQHA